MLKLICKKKKLSLVTSTDGTFRLSGDCFCRTSAEPRYIPPRDQKTPFVKDSYILALVITAENPV